MSHTRTVAAIEADLAVWYSARTAAAAGKSITIATSAGSRTLSQHDLSDINETINALVKELVGAETGERMGLHSFAVANMNTDKNP